MYRKTGTRLSFGVAKFHTALTAGDALTSFPFFFSGCAHVSHMWPKIANSMLGPICGIQCYGRADIDSAAELTWVIVKSTPCF